MFTTIDPFAGQKLTAMSCIQVHHVTKKGIVMRAKTPFVFAILIACTVGSTISTVWAETYPSKPIRIIIPWTPGGASDIMARIVAERLSRNLAQNVIPDNRPGAAGIIGTGLVATAAPDGYTLLAGSTGPNAIYGSLYNSLPYEQRNFTPIIQIAESPLVLVVNASLPVKSVKELIAYAKLNPNKINFASVGAGTSKHLAGEMFKLEAKIDIVHVPYKGSAPALTAILGGDVQMMFDAIPASMAQIQAGKIKALAVTSGRRSSALPDVPTVAESGLPGFNLVGWNNVLAPAGTPSAIIKKLNAEIARLLKEPDIAKRILDLGASIATNSVEEEAARSKAEEVKWAKVVKSTGLKLDY
jgi:tripartite-type tricarboxylate transporter receptor subunit TctC